MLRAFVKEAGAQGVKLTGYVIHTKDDKWQYIEEQDVAGGTRPFTDATCTRNK